MYDFSTVAFDNLYNKAVKEGQELHKEAKTRRIMAYVLKGIAVLSGIALSTGLPKQAAQVLGIIVAVVIAIDTLFANHKRLIVITAASNAYKNLFDKIGYAYNHELQGKVIAVRDSPKGDRQENQMKAFEALTKLNQDFSTLIYENTSRLKKKIQDADLAFLESVAQDKNEQRMDTKELNTGRDES